jgi:hypothetical protein
MSLRATKIMKTRGALRARGAPWLRFRQSGTGASRADQGVRPTTARFQGSGGAAAYSSGIPDGAPTYGL